MRIFLRIAVGVVHPVHNGVSAGVEKRRSLSNKREQVKKAVPKTVHGEHLVRCIAVQEEYLTKERQKPMTQEKNQNIHSK